MTKEFKSRFDIRVETSLKEQFKKACTVNNITLSDGVRDALDIFIFFKPFVNSLIESLQDPEFYSSFFTFYKSMPDPLRKSFDDLFGPEEEKLVNETPKQILKSINVVTERGIKRLKELYYKDLK